MNAKRSSILLIGDTLNFGGTEGQFVEIACRLNRARWDVRVCCISAQGPLRVRLESAGVRAWSCGRGSFKSPRFALAVVELAGYLRARRIRLVHSFDFYSNILGLLAAWLARAPVMIASQRDLGNLRPSFQQRVHRMALRLADHVLVNSEAVAERVRLECPAMTNRIIVVPNGLDLGRFSPPSAACRREGEIVVGTVANLSPQKGLEYLVQAAALVRERFPGVRFVLWGEGPLRPHLEQLVASLQLGRGVELPGWTAQPEVALRTLDIFVLPSLSEACPNVLLEAMATGLPVVATQVGGIPGLVQDEESGLLVPPADPAALAKAVIRLVEDPRRAAVLGASGRERARTMFAMDRMVARIEALYDRALAERGR